MAAGTNTVVIRYWYFYAWQSGCFDGIGHPVEQAIGPQALADLSHSH